MRHQHHRRVMLSLMAVLGMAVALTMVGCGGDNTHPATPADLETFTFTFPDGAAFSPALAGQETILTFGAFVDNQGTFTLAAGGHTASGDVVIKSCEYTVTSSDFPAGEGPQVGDMIVHDPCEIDNDDGSYSCTNVETGETCQSNPIITGTTGTSG